MSVTKADIIIINQKLFLLQDPSYSWRGVGGRQAEYSVYTYFHPIGTTLANSAKFCGIRPRIHFENVVDNVTLMLHNVTLTSQKPSQHNNKCDCSKANSCI